MRKLILIIGMVVFALPALSQGNILTGNLLEEKCSYERRIDAGEKLTNEEFQNALFCVGYIRGAVDSLVVQNVFKIKLVSEKGEWKTPCFPETASNNQFVKIILKYFADNPSKLHLPATMLILAALNDAFPCH